MNLKALLAATIAGGIIANVLDFAVQGGLLSDAYYSKMPQLFRQDANLAAYVIGDFIAVAVFAWFWQTVAAASFRGLAGGLKFGVYTGIVVSFPFFVFLHMMLVGFPYALSWIWVAFTIFWYAVVGAVVALVYERMG